jgi:hypothetical protein
VLTGIDVSVGKEFYMALVKITHFPRPARDLDSVGMWDNLVERGSTG